jgi:hypothetical protein
MSDIGCFRNEYPESLLASERNPIVMNNILAIPRYLSIGTFYSIYIVSCDLKVQNMVHSREPSIST